MARDGGEETAGRSEGRGFVARLGHELRTHVVAYSVLVLFAAAGPLVVSWIFPDVSPWVGLAGGLALGIYAALCAVPDRFYE
ncbi:MAG TPA: hypothetical protein VHQ66_00580 [Myxococcota bacterium]|nr:hypothetical protein [Myxococcota bacterium]